MKGKDVQDGVKRVLLPMKKWANYFSPNLKGKVTIHEVLIERVFESLKVCKSFTNKFPSSSTCLKTPNLLKWVKKWLKDPEGFERCVKSVREWVCEHDSVWKCHQWVAQLECIILDAKLVEIGRKISSPKLVKECADCVRML